MIYIIFTIVMTLAYQVADEDRTPESLDEKVREQQPYLDADKRRGK